MNNDYFTLERSRDVENWTEVGDVKGAGNSQTPLMYSMNDYEFYPSITYYRLKQTDFNNKVTYSQVVAVNTSKGENKFVSGIYPNITNENFSFELTSSMNTPVTLEIVDAFGKTVFDSQYLDLLNGQKVTVDVSDLASGVYQVVLTQGSDRVVEKLVVERN